MFDWLKKLFGRAEPPPNETESIQERKPTVENLRWPKPDLVARPLGQKRNRFHVLLGDRTSVGMDNHGHGKGASC
jgi:hypothetical protein